VRRLLAIVFSMAVMAGALAAPAAASSTPPVCEKVWVQENPAFPAPQINYPIELCGDKALPVRHLTVDGAALPEHSTTHHRVVFWDSSTAAPSASRRASSTFNISSSSCHNEWVLATTNLAGTKPWTQWVKGNGTAVNGCGWQQRCHVHFGVPRIGDDDGWVNGGWVRSGTIVSGCNSPDGDGWFVFDFQWRSSNGVVHTVRVSP
jgi:hypothetical protein